MTRGPEVRPALSRVQRRKLRRLVLDAHSNVPMYRALYEPLNLSERDFADPHLLARLPVITKSQLLADTAENRVNRRYRMQALTRETTTGSTGQPFSIYLDRRYRLLRNLRFLKGLLAVGFRPWHRLLLLTDRYAGLSRHNLWYYQSVESPTEALVDAYLQVCPEVLYGFATPLRLLAECLAKRPRATPGPSLVVSTAEMLDAATRLVLESAFGCPVADFYGMTETGLVAWQPAGRGSYVVAHNSVVTELLADESCAGRYRIVMTNLELHASPIIRFDSGDLAFAGIVDGRPSITAIEGRRIDSIACRDGSAVSPYRVTDALRDVPGLRRFKVSQRTLSRFEIAAEVDVSLQSQAAAHIRSIFEKLFGGGLELEFSFSEQLVTDGTRKFRPVESLVPRN